MILNAFIRLKVQYVTALPSTFPTLYGGPSDNNFGSGSYFQGNKYLIFNNYKVSNLKSVLVYANSAGYRTIELRNSSNAILSDTTIYIPFPPNGIRIDINFILPIQNNMQLGIDAPNSDLFRTSSGAIFPYNISDIVSITGTNAPAGYYYFFYDWEIIAEPCISNIAPTQAIINHAYINTDSLTICGGDSILVGNSIYNSAGTYTDSLVTMNGCDSIIYTDVEIIDVNITQNDTTICFGDSINLNIEGVDSLNPPPFNPPFGFIYGGYHSGSYYFASSSINSWGTNNLGNEGYIYASEAYLKLKSISVLVNKAGVPKKILKKLNL